MASRVLGIWVLRVKTDKKLKQQQNVYKEFVPICTLKKLMVFLFLEKYVEYTVSNRDVKTHTRGVPCPRERLLGILIT